MYEFQPDHHETTTSRIPKLNEDGSNWVLFKEQFVAAVSAKGLVRFLDGREKVPVPTTAPGVDPDADERYEAAQDIWVAKHQTIRTLLFQTLPEAIKLRIAPLQRASEAWKTVVDEYDDQGEFVQVELLRQMHALRCEENTNPRPTLNKLERLPRCRAHHHLDNSTHCCCSGCRHPRITRRHYTHDAGHVPRRASSPDSCHRTR